MRASLGGERRRFRSNSGRCEVENSAVYNRMAVGHVCQPPSMHTTDPLSVGQERNAHSAFICKTQAMDKHLLCAGSLARLAFPKQRVGPWK